MTKMNKQEKRAAAIGSTCAVLYVVLQVRDRRRHARIQRHNEQVIKDMKRGNKELEALESDLADRVQTARFWLQVTEKD